LLIKTPFPDILAKPFLLKLSQTMFIYLSNLKKVNMDLSPLKTPELALLFNPNFISSS